MFITFFLTSPYSSGGGGASPSSFYAAFTFSGFGGASR